MVFLAAAGSRAADHQPDPGEFREQQVNNPGGGIVGTADGKDYLILRIILGEAGPQVCLEFRVDSGNRNNHRGRRPRSGTISETRGLALPDITPPLVVYQAENNCGESHNT